MEQTTESTEDPVKNPECTKILFGAISVACSTIWLFYIMCQTLYLFVKRKTVDNTIKSTMVKRPLYQMHFDEAQETKKRCKLLRSG